ncbi:MAG: DUF4124 domain-containing protein [Deltaproteobacteria bacterium]|nr:DUF4124 domain-containing protein [Deltaproteobacteria bacterium]
MKPLKPVLIALIVLSASPALAELYQWKDSEGVVHITDRPENIPERYTGQVRVIEESVPLLARDEGEMVQRGEPRDGRGDELYGDHPLEWWRQTFMKRSEERSSLESGIAAKRQLIEVYEGGRRFGQIYASGEVETYARYKKELPDDQERLSKLIDEIGELRRKAAIAGVPRDIRGE